jgi:hypothetical protein
MSIEHRDRQGTRPELRDIYSNTFLACRFCNGARVIRPLRDEATNALMLDPTAEAWADHFTLSANQLSAKVGDANAAYTSQAYDLNDPRKVALRRERAAILGEALEALVEGPKLVSLLMSLSSNTPDLEGRETLVAELKFVYAQLERAKANLRRFRAIPLDADSSCRCMQTPQLPRHLAEQCSTVELG